MLRILQAIVFIFSLGVATAYAAVSGQVVDEKGAPVGGAFIVTTWRGDAPSPFSANTECYSVLVTRTAPDGTFKIPTSSPDSGGLLLNRKSYSSVYVPGYRSESVQRQGGMTRLRRSEDATVKRVRTLLYKIHPTCVNPSRVRDLAPIFKALYEEALALEPSENLAVKQSLSALKRQYEAASAGTWP